MKKGIILSAIALCLLALPGKAQEPVRNVEFEMGFGGGIATRLGKTGGSYEFKMELRCNLSRSHWDLGMYFATGGTEEGTPYSEFNNTHLDEVTTYMLPVIDYNWRRGKNVSYFIGGGLGMYTSRINGYTDAGMCFMPRIGAEFFNRLRLTADYKWNLQGTYDYLNFSVGFVFGGGRKQA